MKPQQASTKKKEKTIFTCSECPYESDRKLNLDRHVNSKHGEESEASPKTKYQRKWRNFKKLNDEDVKRLKPHLKDDSVKMSKKDINKIMCNTSLSVRKLKKVMSIIRASLGKNSVVLDLQNVVKERNNILENIILTTEKLFL